MTLCQAIERARGSEWRGIGAVALVTIAVTLAFMQIEGPTPTRGGSYKSPSWAITIHLATVLPALVLGPFILLRRKGDPMHRRLGTIWMGLMVATAFVT